MTQIKLQQNVWIFKSECIITQYACSSQVIWWVAFVRNAWVCQDFLLVVDLHTAFHCLPEYDYDCISCSLCHSISKSSWTSHYLTCSPALRSFQPSSVFYFILQILLAMIELSLLWFNPRQDHICIYLIFDMTIWFYQLHNIIGGFPNTL